MPLLEKYVQILTSGRVRERALFPPQRIPSELELQARWFAGDFGKHFVTPAGEKIDIVQFGVWNREAGPDFSDAAIRVNGSEPMRGSIEFDLTDRNWEAHGHATNPAFEDTVLHVFVHPSERTFFARTRSNREVRQVRADPNALADTLSANIPLARPGRCQAPLRNLPEDRVRRVLDAAAQSSAAPSRRAGGDFGEMAGVHQIVRQNEYTRHGTILFHACACVLGFSLHTDLAGVTRSDGHRRQNTRNRDSRQRGVSVLCRGGPRCLERIFKTARAPFQSAAGHWINASLWR